MNYSDRNERGFNFRHTHTHTENNFHSVFFFPTEIIGDNLYLRHFVRLEYVIIKLCMRNIDSKNVCFWYILK